VPTYQYACTECGHAFEQFQNFSDDTLTVCPECEGRLRKLFSAVGVVFKGSGFYRTDSRPADKSESGSTKDAPKSDAPKTDAPKSETPAASKSKETATT
jgi:putative FmdB family regulatory protein